VNAASADTATNRPANSANVFKGATPALKLVRDIVRILTASASTDVSTGRSGRVSCVTILSGGIFDAT
jgi:hypothetical protein